MPKKINEQLEQPQDEKISFLDTMVIKTTPHHFDTCFFSKSLNSNHLLPSSSNVSKIRKINQTHLQGVPKIEI